MIEKMIYVAVNLIYFRNISALIGVLTGLGFSLVERLKKSFEEVSEKSIKVREMKKKLISFF